MPASIHPLEATQRIREDYSRYLRTIYFFHDPTLRAQFWQALDEPDFLVKGPILEASPPFKTGRSIRELVEAGILHTGFRTLCSDALPWDRPLYLHQDQAIEKVAGQQRNVVVATGTGSGKTEAFLVPIFDHLMREHTAGTLTSGVRALLLYPMNALANDQLKRLRGLLAKFPQITFGRYTGETKQTQVKAEEYFREQFPDDPRLPNELISREEMQGAPPHILLTNYAMLEYLLLRPRDTPFFDGPTGKFWRFIALDEAHTYDGAQGIEIAMLLRRLKDRVVQSAPRRLRCIATSATIGRGREDFADVGRFATELFGEPFEWDEADVARQDIVEGQRIDMGELSPVWGEPLPEMYGALADAIVQGEEERALVGAARAGGIPADVVERAVRASGDGEPDQRLNRFLFEVLRGDDRVHRLREILREPQLLTHIPGALKMRPNRPEDVVKLVELAVRARTDANSSSLLPARYHVFARSLEGAFICLNEEHPSHAQSGKARLFMNRFERCPHCEATVFELATCPRCGTAYIVGREENEDEGGHRHVVLRQPKMTVDDPVRGLIYLMLQAYTQPSDEDDAILGGEDVDSLVDSAVDSAVLCLGCGAIETSGADTTVCGCPRVARRVRLHLIQTNEDRLTKCHKCGHRNPNGVVYRFLTGQDAPVSVLATSLYQMLPGDRSTRARDLPGEGRKLLSFADSRQDAAFFASYLENTYESLVRRRVILQALEADDEARSGRLRLQDLVSRLQRIAEQAGMFEVEESFDGQMRVVRQWLMQELIALDTRQALEGLGLLRFRLIPPRGWQPPMPLLAPPWSLTPDDAWTLLVTLLNTLRQQGAVTFPENVDPRDSAFEPRNVELFVAETSTRGAIFGWMPKRGGNRRLDFLTRLLVRRAGMEVTQAQSTAHSTLQGLWRYLTDPSSVWRTHLAPERHEQELAYRLNYKMWEWVPPSAGFDLYRCDGCFGLAYTNLSGVCGTPGCEGTLLALDKEELGRLDNHYRSLYLTLEPIPMRAEEHTAQWTPEAGGQVQNRFVRGEINVLSCSTTFELGVDVGELQAVIMRNVPPTTANYVQRAGRAGRRTDSVAFVLTYAQRRSHDLTHFARPTDIVRGRVRPPVVYVTNEKIVRRHIHSTVLAHFFRWAIERHSREFSNVGDFFAPGSGNLTGPQLIEDFLRLRLPEIQTSLSRIVPVGLQDELGIATWKWTERLMNDAQDGILDRAVREVDDELKTYSELESDAVQRKQYSVAGHFQRVAQTLRRRELFGFLGTRNVVPEYGFPTDVVEMKTAHIPHPVAERVRLSRDLRIAIAEYAPGSQVIAAKHVWTSAGLTPMPDRHWRSYSYAVCRQCNRFYRSASKLEGNCECGAGLFTPANRHGQYVKPEFGFLAGPDPKPARGG